MLCLGSLEAHTLIKGMRLGTHHVGPDPEIVETMVLRPAFRGSDQCPPDAQTTCSGAYDQTG